jgi:hypothetical protein
MVEANTNRAPARERFNRAVHRLEELNSADPNIVSIDGVNKPRELAYAEWLAEWVKRLLPQASEELLLAARCQHLCRWMIARESYPMTRPGYLKWRADLKKFHAEKAAEVLAESGYDQTLIESVRDLNLKKNFPAEENSRVLEDALCLVFLERQLADLAAKVSEDKVINALQKSWKKMTPKAQAIALELKLPQREKALIQKALAPVTIQ